MVHFYGVYIVHDMRLEFCHDVCLWCVTVTVGLTFGQHPMLP